MDPVTAELRQTRLNSVQDRPSTLSNMRMSLSFECQDLSVPHRVVHLNLPLVCSVEVLQGVWDYDVDNMTGTYLVPVKKKSGVSS